MRYSSLILTMLFTIYCGGIASAQSKDELKDKFLATVEQLSKLKNFKGVVHYTVYAAHVGGKVLDSKNAKISFAGARYSYDFGSLQTVHDGEAFFMVHHGKKMIAITKNKNASNESVERFNPMKLQSLLSSKVCNVYKDESKGQLVCEVTYPDHSFFPYTKCKIAVDAKSGQLKKVVFFFRESAKKHGIGTEDSPYRMEVDYKEVDLSPSIESSAFSMSKYLEKVNGGYQLTPAYSKYKVIQQ